MPSSRVRVALPVFGTLFGTLLGPGCGVDGVDGIFGNPPAGGGSGQGGESEQVTTTVSDTVTSTSDVTTTSPPTTGPDPTTTTGPEPTQGTVYCNHQACDAGQVCCFYQYEKGSDHCSAAGACSGEAGWVELSCNGPDDCPGEECCGWWDNQVGWGTIACAEDCQPGQIELCFGDESACEASSQFCVASEALGTGYSFCDDT